MATLWDWCCEWFKKHRERKFSADEVKDLVERIKQFNAGCIDLYLTQHVDYVLEEWLSEKS